MQKTQIKYTYSDYLLLPEEDRRELIDGVFYVVPSPNFRHQTIIYYLGRLLADFVEENSLGTLRWAPLDVKLSDYDVVQPDILFVSKDRRHTIAQNFISAAPDLAIEVLSPSTQDRDKELKLKLKLYAEFGVREYWIVDPIAESVRVLQLGPESYDDVTYASGSLSSSVLEGLSLDLSQIFSGD